jgi:hypothetical protein
MNKLSISSVWQIKHTKNCNICKDCALEFSDLESYVSLHKIIRLSGKYNFESSRIPVNSGLNISFIRKCLHDYHDFAVCDLLEYGWPVGHLGTPVRSSTVRNHKGATNFSADIHNYLRKEKSYNAVVGPFKANPFIEDMAISPLNSVPKKDSIERRVIVDLSFPDGLAVNDGISKDLYLGEKVSVHYPTVDDFVRLIKKKGRNCKIFKRDLRRAYRQLIIDPGDIHLMGYKWKGHIYFDRVLTMGLRSAAYICMRTTSAIRFICQKNGIQILNYLDDLAGCEEEHYCNFAFDFLGKLLQDCGIEESVDKACPPSTRMIFIGILFDTQKLTIAIDENRLTEIRLLVECWMHKMMASKKELQSLLGKLNFVAQCVKPGRIFISRLLNWLREISDKGSFCIPLDLKLDLLWWNTFLPLYNGVSIMLSEEFSSPDEILSVDACLLGCGGWMNGRYFHSSFPNFLLDQNLNINLCEMLTIVVALKLWGLMLVNKKVVINCDNMVSVRVLNTGASRNSFLQSCLREICYIAALNNFDIKSQHISGCDNRIADTLSRWDLHDKFRRDFKQLTSDLEVIEDFVSDEFFLFSHVW